MDAIKCPPRLLCLKRIKIIEFPMILAHTYIIGHYNPSVRIIDLVSHTTYVECVLILYISGGGPTV